MATQASRIEALESGLSQVIELLTAQAQPASDESTDDKPTAKDKAAQTRAKAGTVTRNLDSITFGDEEHGVAVVAASNAGTLYANGSRVVPLVNGKPAKSFSRQTLEVLGAEWDDVMAAMDAVDKRAKIGDHKPAKAS